MGLSIIIPCYNEAANLPALVNKCKEVCTANPDIEIILVNNGSTDNSSDVMKTLLQSTVKENIKSHDVLVNQGYGYGILAGLKVATKNILCWTHADLQTDIFDCLKALKLYHLKTDDIMLIKGRRKGRPLFDRLFTSLMSYYVLVKLGKFIPDINAQPKLFSRKFYEKIVDNAPHDFSLDLYFLLHARKSGKITEFPVDFSQRLAGEAKGGGSGNIKLKLKLTKRTLDFVNKFN